MRTLLIVSAALGCSLGASAQEENGKGTNARTQEAEFVNIVPVDVPFETTQVAIEPGILVGETVEGVNVFRGVPYAAPPVGERRWRAPQPVEPWVGKRAALAFEPPCPQPVSTDPSIPNQGGVAGAQSEDCLYLQVYAPREAQKAPVVVWLHGGGSFLGAGHLGSYVGTSNAKKGVVTVAINYRLGPLGYFAHPALAPEDGPTGSYAMMDAVKALQWVQDNISAFGGDPENVTVAGQSAGAVMVINLLATPSAEGLFDKAVVQSGAYLPDGTPLAEAEEKVTSALQTIGVPEDASTEELRQISPQTFAYAPDLRRGFGNILDGEFQTRSAEAALQEGTEINVPLLIGANSGERGFQAARHVADLAADESAGVWLYRFDYVPDFRKQEWPKGAIHSAELMFTFDSLETSGWAMGKTDESDADMAGQVSSCWIAFYKMAPGETQLSCAEGFTWPAYSEETGAVANFGETIRLEQASSFPDGPG